MIRFLKIRLSTNTMIMLEHFKKGFREVTRELIKSKLALTGIVILSVFLSVAVFSPYIVPYSPDMINYDENGGVLSLLPPSKDHIMGTTFMGRDVFSQLLDGARGTLLIAFLSGLAILIIGVNVGLIAGYYKGAIDALLMRLVDTLYGIPDLPFILIIALFIGPSIWTVILVVVLILWRTMARIIRSQTLSLSERPFVKAAKASGAGDFRIIYLHIAPNVASLIFAQLAIMVGFVIILESSASFLGVGSADIRTWGQILQYVFATGAIRHAWWWTLPPGACIALLVMSVFFLSKGIENITNPELEGR